MPTLSRSFLKGQRAVITGGSTGIGSALATEISSLGGLVTILSRNQARLETKVQELNREFPNEEGKHDFVVYDLKNPHNLPQTLQDMQTFQEATMLINCAGLSQARMLMNTPLTEIQDIVNVNLVSPILLCKFFLKHAVRSRPSLGNSTSLNRSIINISSVVSQDDINLPGSSVYTASKGALTRFTHVLREEQQLIEKRRPTGPHIGVHVLNLGLVPETAIGSTVKHDNPLFPTTSPTEICSRVAQLLQEDFSYRRT